MRRTGLLVFLSALAGCGHGGSAVRNAGAALAPDDPHTVTASLVSSGQYVTTLGGQSGIKCTYRYGSTVFDRTFVASSCPYQIQVQ